MIPVVMLWGIGYGRWIPEVGPVYRVLALVWLTVITAVALRYYLRGPALRSRLEVEGVPVGWSLEQARGLLTNWLHDDRAAKHHRRYALLLSEVECEIRRQR